MPAAARTGAQQAEQLQQRDGRRPMTMRIHSMGRAMVRDERVNCNHSVARGKDSDSTRRVSSTSTVVSYDVMMCAHVEVERGRAEFEL